MRSTSAAAKPAPPSGHLRMSQRRQLRGHLDMRQQESRVDSTTMPAWEGSLTHPKMPACANIEDGADDGYAQGHHQGPAGSVEQGEQVREVGDLGHGVPGDRLAPRPRPKGL